jgi:hypothetical protein
MTSVEMNGRSAKRPATKLSKYISHSLCDTMFHTYTNKNSNFTLGRKWKMKYCKVEGKNPSSNLIYSCIPS